MSLAELFYFNGRGRAELTRMVLTACGIKFKENILSTRDQFLSLKPDLLYGQLPMLKIDGQNIVQTNAIVRHLARTHKMEGQDEKEKTLVDQYYEGSRDFFASFLVAGFSVPLDKVAEHAKPAVDRYLPIYEKILKGNGSNGYLVGSSLTLADLGLLEALLMVDDYFGQSAFDSYPEVQKFMKTLSTLQFYGDYCKNIRKPKNSPEYIASVKLVLGY